MGNAFANAINFGTVSEIAAKEGISLQEAAQRNPEPRYPSQPVDNQNLVVDRLEPAVDTGLLTVDTLEVPHAQSQLLSADINTGFNLHNCNCNSNLRQARCGHRGDAHIGEASHPGPKRASNTDGPDTDVSGPRRVKTRASVAPVEAVASFSVKETNDAMRVSLLEDQKITEFSLKRHKLLGNKLDPLDVHTISVPSDGNCQFAALELGLVTLVEHAAALELGLANWPPGSERPNFRLPAGEQRVAREGHRLSFQYGDAVFRGATLPAYDDTHTYELYCALMRNPEGVKANCEWIDALTLSAAMNV